MKQKQLNLTLLLGMLFIPMLTLAQQSATTTNSSFWGQIFGNLTILVGAVIILGALFAVVQLFNAMAKMEEIKLLREKGIEEIVEKYRQPQESIWSRIVRLMTRTVPVEQEADILMDHNYDGIRELDNSLPPWWLWMFYITIIFSVIYMGYYHLGSGPGQEEEYKVEMERAQASIAAYNATQAEQINEDNVVALTSADDLEAGKTLYLNTCVACHGSNAEGNTIGPNLTDEYWLHGGGMKEIFKIVKNGVIEKGMQPWKDLMRASDMQKVSSYILSLQGTNPPNARAPQGDLWKTEAPAPEAGATQDTTATKAEPGKTQ